MPDAYGNWFERAVDTVYGALWPQKAAVRRHLRRMERDTEYREASLLGLRLRGYRAAGDRKGQTPWTSGNFVGRSPDSEILWELPKLRNRSRELNRDDPLGSGLTAEFTRKVVGCGLRPQARTEDPDKNAAIEAVLAERTANLDPANGLSYGALQRLRVRKRLEDGEVWLVASVRQGEDGRDHVVTETVEADRVMSPADAKPRDPDGQIRAGVEKDRDGVPVAYHILKRYQFEQVVDFFPGSAIGTFTATASSQEFDRVEATRSRHSKRVDRPGQTRGVPWTHAVMQDLRDLDLLLLATLKRTQIAACLAVFLESSEATSAMLPVTAETYGYQLDQDIEPGMIFKLYPGEKVSQVSPNFPLQDIEVFAKLLARRIGAALGVSWQTVLSDWSEANYSSARTQILDDRITYGIERDALIDDLNWEVRQILEWELMQDERLIGAGVTSDDIASIHWIADAEAWVDPEKEAKAIEIKLALGLTTLRDEIARQGQEWEEVLRQRLLEEAREAEIREELGLAPKVDPDQAAPAESDTEEADEPQAVAA